MTTNVTPNVTPAATPAVTPKPAAIRPLTLTIGAIVMALVALFTFATPFLRVGNFGGNGQRRANAGQRLAPGQLPGQGGNGQGGGAGRGNQAGGTGTGTFGNGQGTGGFGGTARTGGNFALFGLIQPLRIGEAIVAGLFALIAAVGLLQRRKWGMVLAVIAAVVVLLTTGVASLLPLLFRGAAGAGFRAAANPLTIWLTLLTRPTWESIVLIVLTVAVVVLALLPMSRAAYVVKPKVRRVM